MNKLRILGLSLLAVVSSLLSCDKEETFINLPVYGPQQIFYAISGNNLLVYNASSVKTNTGSVALTNLAVNERILSMDFNSYTGQLYGLSNLSKIYIINTNSGVAKALNSDPFSKPITSLTASLDFDPTTNTIKVITVLGQNLTVSPETGMATENPETQPDLYALASNGTAGAASNTFYAINPTTNTLYKQEKGTATWADAGKLDVTLGSNNSFDISPDDKNALAVSKTAEGTRLFSIDLNTGKATLAGKFPNGLDIQCIAIPATPIAYGISGQNLIYFNPTATSTLITKAITGLQPDETVVAMDMRPKNGQLFAVGSTSRLYSVNPATGVFTAVGSPFSTVLNGTDFGADFNPATDQLSVVSNTGQFLTIAVNGTATALPNLPVANHFSAIAYNNNFSDASTSTLFAIDASDNKLYTISDAAEVTAIEELGVPVTASNGFDIYSVGNSNTALFVSTDGSKSTFLSIDLSTGKASEPSEQEISIRCFCLGLRL